MLHKTRVAIRFRARKPSPQTTRNFALVYLWCGRTVGRCTVTWLPNFLGWVVYHIFLPTVLRCARFARESSAIKSNQSRRAIHVQEIWSITDKTTYHTHRMIFDCRTCLVERMSDTNKDVDGDDDDDDDDANNNE